MSKYNWMPILRTGNFTDKNNNKVSIDEAKLDQVITNTDLSKEPQFVIDHPGFDEVGFGTIDKLKRVGNYLFALPKTVNDKFKEAVNSGKLPSRSVTLDKNTFALNNISFLNKKLEPAVSGLGDYSFSTSPLPSPSQGEGVNLQVSLPGIESHFADLETSNYEFAKYEVSSYPFRTIQTIFRNIKNFLIENFTLEKAEEILPEYYMNEIGTPPQVYETSPSSSLGIITNEFQKNQKDNKMLNIDTSKLDAAVKAAFDALQVKVTDLEKNLNDKNVELQAATTKITAAEKEKIETEVLQFCQGDDIKLKIKPADKEKFVQFLAAQKEKEVIEFSAADGSSAKAQLNAFEFAKELVKSLPDLIELQEIATNGKAGEQLADYQKTAKAIADAAK